MSLKHSRQVRESTMSASRLRQHLFENPIAEFWNHDPDRLSIGIEVEYFIAHKGLASLQLATEGEYFKVIRQLKDLYGYRERNLEDQPGRVSRDTAQGFVVIKPDFAWHILEISLPPRASLLQIRHLLTEVFSEVDTALSKVGLERLDISCLPDPPVKMDLVKLDRLGLITETFKPRSAEKVTQDPSFPAYITATHVHLNVSNEAAMACLPNLYTLDRIIAGKFNRAKIFRGGLYDNVRTALYRDTLGEDYLLHTYPVTPATSLQELSDQMNRSPKLFPLDKFFPVRDMSYIRPTRYGTMEFRSACSYKAVEHLIEIVRWRVAQILAATGVEPRESTPELRILRKCIQKESA